MAEKPLIENLKDKLKVSKKGNDDYSEEHTDEGNVSDVLERFRIPLSIDIPNAVMTSKEASGVRFGYTKPHGFSQSQVEKFHSEVLQSVKWYVKSLEQRDKHIHKLATEVDKCLTDLQNTRFQLEAFQGLGQRAMVDEDGNYITEDDLSESERLLNQKDSKIIELENEISLMNKDYDNAMYDNKKLREEIQNLKSSNNPLPSIDGNSGLSPADAEELQTYRDNSSALDEWEKAVTDEYNRVENELNVLKETLASGGNVNAELLEAKESEINELRISLQEHIEALNETNSALDESSAELANAHERLENSKIVVAELNKKIADAGDDASTLMAEIAKMEEMQSQVTSLQKELADSEAAYIEAAETAHAIDAELTKTKQDLDVVEKNIESLNAEKTELEAQLVEAIETANAIEEERQRLEGLTNVAPNTDEIDKLKNEIDQLENHITEMEKYAKELEEVAQSVSQEIPDDNSALLKEYEERLVANQAQIKKLTEEIKDLRENVDEYDVGVQIEGYKRLPGISAEDLGLE